MTPLLFDTAKMVAHFKAGGFTEEQAEVLTYALLDVAVKTREYAAAQLRQQQTQQEADQAWRSRIDALNRDTDAKELLNKLWMNGSLAVLFILNIVVWLR